MADKKQIQRVEALGEGFKIVEEHEIPDEALEGISGGALSSPVCPSCGNTSNSYISGPNAYYRYCPKCGISWPYWV